MGTNEPDSGARGSGRWRRGALGALAGLFAFKAVKVAAIGISATAVGVGGMAVVTSRPGFCTNCHNMVPYYESWKKSAHKDVTCVACHFPPGLEGTVRGKLRGLSQVTQYFTGGEGSKPFAQISDASCTGCHPVATLSRSEPHASFRARFDHAAHLTGPHAPGFLACTACHTQVLRDEHMTVGRAACHLCHLRPDAPPERSACTLCHEPPGVVSIDGGSFDHARIERAGIECAKCHAGITEGSGRASRQACLRCHNASENLSKIDDPDVLHRRHVSVETVACLDCHAAVRHSLEPQWVMTTTSCETCHPGHHASQRRMFSGTGAKGIEPTASPMFKVRTGCLACHVSVKHADGEVVLSADPRACETCHDPGFGDVLEGWKSFGEERGGELGARFEEVRGRVGAFAGAPEAKAEAERRLADVEANLHLVRLGRSAHNFPYAEAIFDAAEKELDAIDGILGKK